MALFGAADAVRAVSPLCRNLIPSSLHNLLNVFLRDLESSNCKGSILYKTLSYMYSTALLYLHT